METALEEKQATAEIRTAAEVRTAMEVRTTMEVRTAALEMPAVCEGVSLAWWVRADCVGHDQVCCSAGGLVRIVDHGQGQLWVHKVCIDGVGWVYEDKGIARIQQVPDFFEIGVAKIMVACTIASE